MNNRVDQREIVKAQAARLRELAAALEEFDYAPHVAHVIAEPVHEVVQKLYQAASNQLGYDLADAQAALEEARATKV